MARLNQAFVQAAVKAMFNDSEWKPVMKKNEAGEMVEERFTLKEIWDQTNPGLYKEIDGDTAEVTATKFADGNVGLNLSIPIKDGSVIQLKISGKSELEEGDMVKVDTITGQELRKIGRDPIVRFDGVATE